jgi:integration host factor subunit beta
MQYDELIERLSNLRGSDPGTAKEIVDAIFEEMARTLEQGGRVEIRNFGSWSVRDHKGFSGLHPKTGLPLVVTPRKRPFFKAGTAMHILLNPESR